ncbi:hypothetical protein [Alkaliphilus hydrothermalis]|uniref:Uncharacterized protein n=1 Tax=Alkaliphilus hydrothermalis TaxID=1482730 RepID=A0ABS2NQF1_9FIRM|nr:hypothetical protein [Alkaliphilus hydrothermalis]MBM7615185.1 hypothetical protein [Alkaliphilus hydrothermalis]
MAEITNAKGQYNLDFLMIPSEYIDSFNNFMTQYGELSDADIYKEILSSKVKVSENVLRQHVNNLDALSQMSGFVSDSTKQRIQMVKRVLTTDTGGSNMQSAVETQFFGGTSLLLWFLTLAAIWRRPFYGFGRGFGRRPFFY